MLIATALTGVYLSLAQSYGIGRAIVCLLTILLGLSSSLFFAASYHSVREEQFRNGLATAVLAIMILSGAVMIGTIVFQPITSVFESSFDK